MKALTHTPEQWSHVSPDAVAAGSTAQCRNVLAMALADIAALAAERDALRAAAMVAFDEMCKTTAPRNSFTEAVDALDAALALSAEGEGRQ